jgi:poly(hydroxyalkanoate) depolymerase family esterase
MANAWFDFFSSSSGASDDCLQETEHFGSNPGSLRMFSYVPRTTGPIPLVVILHGGQQTASEYATGSGWVTLADQAGFALLLPEQRRYNHPAGCFHWYRPRDTERGQGEGRSIISMVEKMASGHQIDHKAVFITGLSAGGAMANAMLAVYPDVFAGGAVIAGVPFGAATDVHEALRVMAAAAAQSGGRWGNQVRKAFRPEGPWPRISIWHGAADDTVHASNARETAKQWLDVHGLSMRPAKRERNKAYSRRVWCNQAGKPTVERYVIADMRHGLPLGREGVSCGRVGQYFLDVGVSSSQLIAEFWGLTQAA